jgi:hypothetical protein
MARRRGSADLARPVRRHARCRVQMGSTSRPPALEMLSGRSMHITSAPPPRFFIRTLRPGSPRRLRDRAIEAQQYRASGLAIVTARYRPGTPCIWAVPSTTSAAAGKSSRTRCLLTSPRRVAAHQSHRRLSMERRRPTRSGWIPAAGRSRYDHGSCRIMFLVCPFSVNPAPFLWRDPIRLMTPKSPYRRRRLAPRCRLIASWG